MTIFGVLKLLFIVFDNKIWRKVSIVSLMFVWGYIWTSSIVETFLVGFNEESILLIPIIAVCGYIAIRSDYREVQ